MLLIDAGGALDVSAPEESGTFDCVHCGLPVPAGLVEPNATEQFCCVGCRVVFGAIRSHGLERYYCMQDPSSGKRPPANPTGRQYRELDASELLDAHAAWVGDGLRSIELYLEGVHCSACVWLVERLPRVAPGVVESRLDLGRALVRVVWQPGQVRLSRIAQTLDSLGYAPHVGRDAESRERHRREDRRLLTRIAIAGAGAGNVMLLAFALYGGSFHGMEQQYSALFRWTSLLIGLVVLLGPGGMFFRGALAALRTRTAHLDLPIAIGLGAGALAGSYNTLTGTGEVYFDSLTALVLLLLVGRYAQRRLERRAKDAVERLFSLTPSFARLREGELVREVPVEALELGQIVEVRPGESFPADGHVSSGDTSTDLSLLTGESRPVFVSNGDPVFAGGVNVERPVLVRVSALGRDTRVGKLVQLMQDCASQKAKIVQLADRFAGYFTLAAIALFALTLVGWYFVDARHALDRAVTLLIVSCPCGLGLATPFAVSVALGRAAQQSILVKGAEALERLATSRGRHATLFLDKTGTLTEVGHEVIAWYGADDIEQRLGPAVAALEAQVTHPIARALATAPRFEGEAVLIRSSRQGLEGVVGGHRYLVGSAQFVTAPNEPKSESLASDPAAAWARDASQRIAERGQTPVWVSVDGTLEAVIAIGGRIRADARATVAKLRARGFRIGILSGDDQTAVSAVGDVLDIAPEHCRGGLSPEDKVAIVRAAIERGPVIMVGDGVNDAAALSAASTGIAVHGGAEASLTAADVYLGRPGVGVLVDLLDGAERTLRVIRRCIVVSLGYNVVAAALAISGHVDALVAAVLMPLASFTVLAMAFAGRTFEPARGRVSDEIG